MWTLEKYLGVEENSLGIFMPVTENMAKQLFAEPPNSYQDLNIYVHIYIYGSQIKYGNY